MFLSGGLAGVGLDLPGATPHTAIGGVPGGSAVVVPGGTGVPVAGKPGRAYERFLTFLYKPLNTHRK